ncbi:MAG: hypothetical protein ACXVFN_03825 [Solirubrobacteraceae bacterium]
MSTQGPQSERPAVQPRPLTPKELHARQRALVQASLSFCPGVKHAPTHRRWA